MSYQLGIDLGTTYTAAAVARGGRVEIASLGDRSAAVPSLVFIGEDGRVLVGDTALRRRLSEPHRVVREFKRRLGDPTPILVAGTPHSAEALMARVLRWVVDRVTEREGTPPELVTVSYPANWGPYKHELLTQAVRLADIERFTVITEPEAAAISYAAGERVEPGEVVAVYDLGGGTFDAAVLRKTESGFEILGQPEGVERLGGIDFDEAVFDHVARALGGALEELDPDDDRAAVAVARLREECIQAKEALSADTDAAVPVLLPNRQTEVRITRAEFEEMIRHALTPSLGALRRVLRSAGVEATAVKAVLLVGGSSRIPLVAELVSAELGRPVVVDAHPKHSIALGAALAAAAAMEPEVVAPAGVDPAGVDPAGVAGVAAAGPPMGADVGARGPAAGRPPGEPPAEPPPTAPAGRAGREPAGRNRRVLVAAVAVALVAAVTLVSATSGGGGESTKGEIFLESASAAGPDPFTPGVAAPQPVDAGATTTIPPSSAPPPSGGALAVTTADGSTPGLYGGTRNAQSCDAVKLVEFLSQNADKAAAFAGVLGIQPLEIPAYVATLTPVLLRSDTRVTNHGFRNGRATPRQSVLQASTAVLVDRTGVPRVKCGCGNPLAPPEPVTTAPRFTGQAWPGFRPTQLQVIRPSKEPVDNLVVVDSATGTPFSRPVGTVGTADADPPVSTAIPSTTSSTDPGSAGSSSPPASTAATASGRGAASSTTLPRLSNQTPSSVASPTTASPATSPSSPVTTRPAGPPTTVPPTTVPPTTVPPTTVPPTTVPAPPVDITAQGTASASSTFSGFPASLSVDGNKKTSWFSLGGSGSTYTWTGPEVQIAEITVVGNAEHPEYPTNFGFGRVVIRVHRGALVVFEQTLNLSGTPDPNVTVQPNVVGSKVTLEFQQPEDPGCGGFSELIVKRAG